MIYKIVVNKKRVRVDTLAYAATPTEASALCDKFKEQFNRDDYTVFYTNA